MWPSVCLAGDARLCKAAIRVSGALPLLVLVLGLAPFSPPINAYMGLPALAARALRVVGEGESCKEEEEHLSLARNRRDFSLGSFNKASGQVASSRQEQQCWRKAAVPHLARLIGAAAGLPEGTTKQGMQSLPRLPSINSTQKLSECSPALLGKHCWPPLATALHSRHCWVSRTTLCSQSGIR